MLHTLNSTTSVVVVDKEGILTDTQRTIQEVCVAETIARMDKDGISKRQRAASSHLEASLNVSQSQSSGTHQPTPPMADSGARLQNETTDSKLTEIDRSEEASTTVASETIVQRPSLKSNKGSRHSHEYGGRIVFDVLSRPTAPDGQRFEDVLSVRRHINALRPLATIMAAAKLPLGDSQYQ